MWCVAAWRTGIAVGVFLATSQLVWGQSAFIQPTSPAAAMSAGSVGPAPGGTYAPNTSFYGAGGGAAPCGAGGLGGVAGGAGGGYGGAGVGYSGADHPRFFFNNAGGMPQHYPYYPAMHGYYYFHPYHHAHVPPQQTFASQWGVDPRNPYANDFFKVIYAEVKESHDQPPEHVPAAPAGPTTLPKQRVLRSLR